MGAVMGRREEVGRHAGVRGSLRRPGGGQEARRWGAATPTDQRSPMRTHL